MSRRSAPRRRRGLDRGCGGLGEAFGYGVVDLSESDRAYDWHRAPGAEFAAPDVGHVVGGGAKLRARRAQTAGRLLSIGGSVARHCRASREVECRGGWFRHGEAPISVSICTWRRH
jgi:hypothetical protein